MQKIFHHANTRGTANYGWLQANYSFSFANYFEPKRLQFGLLRVLNDDTIAPGMGFGTHPHKNMEIVTIPLHGALMHKDSMNHEEVIEAGEIQVMSAGTGVEHSEYNASKTESINLLQLWVFPDKDEVTPRYDQKRISKEAIKNKLHTVVSPKDESKEDGLWVHQQAYFNLGEFKEAQEIDYKLHQQGHGVYIFLISGEVEVADEKLSKRDAIGVWEIENITIKISKPSKLLLIEVPMN